MMVRAGVNRNALASRRWPTEDAGGALVVTGLVSGYRGGPNVLHDVSLEVARGEILVVLGRNGAGKSTLLRTISGVIPARAGRIEVDGRDLTGRAPHEIARSGIGHVPEGRRVIPGMTVLDNLKLGGHTLRTRRGIVAQLQELYELFPVLPEWRNRLAGTLSGGQQQMLSIARALMARPDVVLLDEPLTGLAPILRAEVLAVIERMKSARAILLVEQNAAETLPVADRALVLHEGRVTLSGAAADLREDDAVQERFLGIPAVGPTTPTPD